MGGGPRGRIKKVSNENIFTFFKWISQRGRAGKEYKNFAVRKYVRTSIHRSPH